jgi:hypothetical protein
MLFSFSVLLSRFLTLALVWESFDLLFAKEAYSFPYSLSPSLLTKPRASLMLRKHSTA